jgi:hypothetical protein
VNFGIVETDFSQSFQHPQDNNNKKHGFLHLFLVPCLPLLTVEYAMIGCCVVQDEILQICEIQPLVVHAVAVHGVGVHAAACVHQV